MTIKPIRSLLPPVLLAIASCGEKSGEEPGLQSVATATAAPASTSARAGATGMPRCKAALACARLPI